jgi:hypothetical protein
MSPLCLNLLIFFLLLVTTLISEFRDYFPIVCISRKIGQIKENLRHFWPSNLEETQNISNILETQNAAEKFLIFKIFSLDMEMLGKVSLMKFSALGTT